MYSTSERFRLACHVTLVPEKLQRSLFKRKENGKRTKQKAMSHKGQYLFPEGLNVVLFFFFKSHISQSTNTATIIHGGGCGKGDSV